MNNRISIACLVVAFVGLTVVISGPGIAAVHLQTVQSRLTREAGPDSMPTEVTYPQLYTTPDGETHFREIRVPLATVTPAPPSPPPAQSDLQPATTIRHVAYPANWGVPDRDHGVFHNASSARYITVRRGLLWIRSSDGETRGFHAGDVIEVLDLAPSKGHITWIGDEGSVVLFSNHP
jgi:hypothetical protein